MPPVAGDLATVLCDALVGILHVNAALIAKIGRDPGQGSQHAFIVPFEDTGEDTPLPIGVYRYGSDIQRGGIKDEREVTLELMWVAEGNGARVMVNELSALSRLALTGTPPWTTKGLDAYVFSWGQDAGDGEDREETRGVYAMRNTLVIHATAP